MSDLQPVEQTPEQQQQQQDQAVPAAAFAGSGGAAPSFTDVAAPANAPKLTEDSAPASNPELEGKLGSVGSYSVDLRPDGTIVAALTVDAAGYLIGLAEKSSNKAVKWVADKIVAFRKK